MMRSLFLRVFLWFWVSMVVVVVVLVVVDGVGAAVAGGSVLLVVVATGGAEVVVVVSGIGSAEVHAATNRASPTSRVDRMTAAYRV